MSANLMWSRVVGYDAHGPVYQDANGRLLYPPGVGLMNRPQAAPQVEEQPAEGTEGAIPVVPFIRASDENLQPGNVDAIRQLTTAQQDLGVFDITAYGYIRFLHVLVQATGGTGAGAVGHEDAPWSVLQSIALTEPNGATIVQFSSGYNMMLAHKYGGYFPPYSADPRRSRNYSAITGTGGNFAFHLIVPVFINVRDGVGALANQDSAGQFKLRVILNSSTGIYTTPPATLLPSVRVRAWLAAYDQPPPSSGGLTNEMEPPGLGTTSFWSEQTGVPVATGDNTIPLKRKGNYLRQVIFVLRSSGTRAAAETLWPAETRFLRDAFPARYYNNEIWLETMFQRTGFGGIVGAEALTNELPGGLDNGVRFHDYMHEFDGGLGRENRDLWQPSRGSTSLEIAGTFGALTTGTLTILTNDIAIGENVFL